MEMRRVMLFWPRFWPLVRRRVRGAHAVAIYDGALHAVERQPGETWQDAATRYLNALGSENDRKQMHSFVQRMLNKHAKHSGEPLGQEEKCRECQLSWKLIARAVSRGDRQERMLVANQSMNLKK